MSTVHLPWAAPRCSRSGVDRVAPCLIPFACNRKSETRSTKPGVPYLLSLITISHTHEQCNRPVQATKHRANRARWQFVMVALKRITSKQVQSVRLYCLASRKSFSFNLRAFYMIVCVCRCLCMLLLIKLPYWHEHWHEQPLQQVSSPVQWQGERERELIEGSTLLLKCSAAHVAPLI